MKKNKKNQNNNQPRLTFDDFVFSGHSEDQLVERFGFGKEFVMENKTYLKKGNLSSPYSQIRNKMTTYPHQVVFYNEKYNLMMTADTITRLITTAMYLKPQAA